MRGTHSAPEPGVRAILCLLLGFLAVTVHAAGASEPDSRDRGTALITFVSYQGNLPLAASPTQMRLAGAAALAEALAARGYRVAAYPDVETVMRRWRVRSDGYLSRGFLEALAAEFGIDRVTVARLDVYRDRLIVLARCVSVDSGSLVAVDVVEEPCGDLWENPEEAPLNWADAVSRAGRALGERWTEHRPAPGAKVLAVMPVRGAGVGSGHASIATYCLLRSLLDRDRWAVPDPSLVESGILDSGCRSLSMTREAREAVTSGFHAGRILVSSLVSFGGHWEPPAHAYDDADEAPVVPYELEVRAPVFLTVTLVDGESGDVLAGGGEYLEPESPSGLFGIAREVRASTRLTKGTNRLVSGVLPRKGEESR